MTPHVDLVLIFRSSRGKVLSKPQARENARQATQQYTRLLDVLKNGRLQVVGKRGEQEGQLLVLVHCPERTLQRLVQRERCARLYSPDALVQTTFAPGIPTSSVAYLPWSTLPEPEIYLPSPSAPQSACVSFIRM